MPGLNQLKQFTEDIRDIGDEIKIRAQRGEKPATIPLPQGISEADDSDDFIIGLPSADTEQNASEPDSLSDDIDLATADIDPEIAALLNPQAVADEDALADFLNDDNPASVSEPEELAQDDGASSLPEEPETPPLEDLDLDSLLQPSGDSSGEASVPGEDEAAASVLDDAAGPVSSDDDLAAALSNLGDLTDLGADMASLDNDMSDTGSELASLDMPENLDVAPAESPVEAVAEPAESPAEAVAEPAVDSVLEEPGQDLKNDGSQAAPAFDMDALGDLDSFGENSSGSDGALGDLGSFDIDSLISGDDSSDEAQDASDAPDFDSGAADTEAPSGDSVPDSFSSEPSAGEDVFSSSSDLGDTPSELDLSPESDALNSFDASPASDFGENGGDSIELGSFDIDSLVADSPDASVPDASESVPAGDEFPMETFDTSAMEGVDFGSPSTGSGDEFPATDDALGNDDDFVLDSSFEIPGFSDTETADMGKKRAGLDTVDFSKAKEARPRNSLTDDEYVQFKKNLAGYPLTLRIALEDFIARDEFTDDAVFEIIEKVLKKTSARQLATQLEKILDISINIPRDFERRSFAEYEAYKQSFQYQLKNRIIPAAIVGIILAFVCFGLFKAGKHFIYEPVMANIHYKQGYTLLEANEFPQSEQEFQEAVSHRPVKNWFFKYAQGYRGKKQYERAGQMYKRILAFFNHDKQAGLEYAEMELYDRANYERAEEIVRREVLDYHINDADGILLLGDVFLEWAEEDASKYELAKEQYLDLMQRYGGNPVYLSRMLRYNIRTDKLREVLTYKNMLYISKDDKKNLKTLGASDWTELSGYLLEKLYGTLSKNDEYLRSSIEDVLAMLNLAIKADPANPIARYNLARYFIQNGNTEQAKVELERSLDLFSGVAVRTKKNVFREINATRVLGELYASNREYLKAQTVYTRGINLYNEEHEASGLAGDMNTGKLFADMGDLDYFISGELDDALYNYEKAIEIKNDTPSINYRVGAIYYNRKNYDNALASFIKVSEKEPKNPNILLSLGNVLSLRGDNFAAESYYSDLLSTLDGSREKQKYLLPQEDEDDFATVDLYLKANNNLGVTLYRLAQQTGNSNMNAEAVVRLSDSMRAYDALTRNPSTMIRLEGSNLAAQNSKYITHPYPEFEPAIYTDIPRVLAGEKGLE